MKKLVASFAVLLFAASAFCTGHWECLSLGADTPTINDTESSAYFLQGLISGHSEWWQLSLQIYGENNMGTSSHEQADAGTTVRYTFKWVHESGAAENFGGRTIVANFKVYGRLRVDNKIYGQASPVSGYDTWGDSELRDIGTNPYLNNFLTGQTTSNQSTANYFNAPYAETYPFVGSRPVSGSGYWSSTYSTYLVDLAVFAPTLWLEYDVQAGVATPKASVLCTTACTIEPDYVDSTYFTTASPWGEFGG